MSETVLAGQLDILDFMAAFEPKPEPTTPAGAIADTRRFLARHEMCVGRGWRYDPDFLLGLGDPDSPQGGSVVWLKASTLRTLLAAAEHAA